MKKNITIIVIALLVLLVGIETGYLIKTAMDNGHFSRQEPHKNFNKQNRGFQVEPFLAHQGFDSWDPFQEMEDMQHIMNRMFRDSYHRGLRSEGRMDQSMSYDPNIDVKENANEYTVRIDLPGIDKDKINVKIENGLLMISGERKTETEGSEENGGFYRSERSFGSFMRSMPLPADADADRMTAQSQNGVLTVHIPKLVQPAKNSGKQLKVD